MDEGETWNLMRKHDKTAFYALEGLRLGNSLTNEEEARIIELALKGFRSEINSQAKTTR